MNPNQSILHGTDYYPEQWLEHPEILKQDIELMKSCGINTVTLGVFAWSMLEPTEGTYSLDWLDTCITNLKEQGINTILATPSAARPAWMAHAYPQVLRTLQDGRAALYGGRHNHCPTSKVYAEKTIAINEALAKRFADREEILYWHVSNELQGACYCESCKQAFRTWLKKQYDNDLDLLNNRWYSRFWSHVYTNWDEIDPPMSHGEKNLHSLIIEHKRFVSDLTAQWVEREIQAIRKYDKHTPTTINLMGLHDSVDYNRLVKTVDVVAADIYPTWGLSAGNNDGMLHTIPKSGNLYRNYRFHLAYYRGLSRGNHWLLMESSPSGTNWHPITMQKRPGVHVVSSLAAIAGGANSVQYFQWRQGRGGWEQFHGSVIDHEGNQGRAYRDVQSLSKALAVLGDLSSYHTATDAALLLDTDSRWMVEQASGPRNDGQRQHIETAMRHFEALQARSISVDVVSRDADFSRYSLVVLPMAVHLDQDCVDRLKTFVKQGGSLVVTYSSGLYDRWQCLVSGGYPYGLLSCLGIRVIEQDQLEHGQSISINWKRDTNTSDLCAYHYCELIEVEKETEVLSTYAEGLYEGSPIHTRHPFEKGYAYYQGARTDDETLRTFYQEVEKTLARKEVDAIPFLQTIPRGMYYDILKNDAEILVFLVNPNESTYELTIPSEAVSVFSERVLARDGYRLFQSWSILVLKFNA